MLCIVYLLYYVNKHQEKKEKNTCTVSVACKKIFKGIAQNC